MRKTVTKLADGRELVYYDPDGDEVRDAADLRPPEPAAVRPELRLDPVLGDWVTVAAHRQGRPWRPPADDCPLCPSRGGRSTEIPAADYHVVVFENRFPSLSTEGAGRASDSPSPLFRAEPGTGRCEVVCFTSDHDASFAGLSESRAALVLDAWIDRTTELAALPGVRQVYCFENRGAEIGVTLPHPHGQIYAYPFLTPRTAKMIARAAEYRSRTGRNLAEDLLAAERLDRRRLVLTGTHWTAFVPFAARWPYEVHLYPHCRVPDLPALGPAERAELPSIYLELLRRFDRLFDTPADGEDTADGDGTGGGGADGGGGPTPSAPTPYIAAWHQAPRYGGGELSLHLELFTIRRAANKFKFLAGVESGQDAFVNDVLPEAAARRLREVAS
ncbi:galactose-1-phosphate uridylyltransferase [Kitasatospora indigofera]|uniref:Galactose-1-phosphate uridylyltransferase n=1 Tax=Kitasatospora indigofera TaxID=67307 RepID=A0A919FIX2_9ACTN|nr:galactose-1-phosphate uridylyltransferase [Kitasatospora indigofera]GHH65572.1 galactose-1-phosphate uridylyltransferase [Kitasatospora indigofera]